MTTFRKVVDREAQRQTRWIKEALWIRKTLMCMNRDAGSYQLSHTWNQVISRSRAPSSCQQSRRDQDVRRTSKRCHSVTHFQLCIVKSFYVISSICCVCIWKLVNVFVCFYVEDGVRYSLTQILTEAHCQWKYGCLIASKWPTNHCSRGRMLE